MTRKLPVVVCLAIAGWAAAAQADGAFPGGLSAYLPPNQSNRIMMGTNFGLVISEDSGATWRFVCELYITGSGADIVNYYKIAPDGAILAVTYQNLWRSTDGGCTWTKATGSVSSLFVTDAFVDPHDASFVLALAQDTAGTQFGIYPSHDGGATFGDAVYTTNDVLTGIEFARSDSNIVYATSNHAATKTGPAYLLKSTDHGTTWPLPAKALPIETATVPRIAQVDPVDPNTVYLRLLTLATGVDKISVTTDGGATLKDLASLSSGTNFFTSFLRANDGTLYAGTASAALYSAAPGAGTMTQRTGGPHVGCLGQRIGTESRLYACADHFLDGYDLGYSDNGAQSFQPILHFKDIQGPLTCPAVNSFCAQQFAILQQTLGGGGDGGTTTPPPPAKPGSGCSTAGSAGVATAFLLVLLWRRRRS